MLLAYNAMVTAVFAEPDYRYHHFMLLLRVLIAGIWRDRATDACYRGSRLTALMDIVLDSMAYDAAAVERFVPLGHRGDRIA